MKIFTSKDFRGHWPVPTAAVILADTMEEAYDMLLTELKSRGLKTDFSVQSVLRDHKQVIILSDGTY